MYFYITLKTTQLYTIDYHAATNTMHLNTD